ncbi:MAG: ATP-binding protein [Pseudomonadota bacterium]|nr:ATP-binding protein [Pseudomonadota bacterium]
MSSHQAPAGTTAIAIDLTSCDSEPIRFPGSIQPHGFLLTLAPDLSVLQASDNLPAWTGATAVSALGQPLHAVIGADAVASLGPELAAGTVGPRPFYLGTITLSSGRHVDVSAHAIDQVTVVEFEAVQRHRSADFRHLYPLLGNFLLNVNDASTIVALAKLGARHTRAVTGFGRVLIYQFDRDGHGHVLAEDRDADYHSYLGQRFPATDVPRQARELYAASRIRLIQDANYTPAPLVPALNPVTGAANDLSFSSLRSVSPVHLQYMRNMGTMASMSVSLMVKGKLWGLISCHNALPMPVGFEERAACEQLGQILALCIGAREDAQELSFRLEVRRIMVSMLAGLTHGQNFIDNLRNVFPELLQFVRADGVAIVVDDQVLAYGDTPDQEQVRALAGWLQTGNHDDLYHTDHLAQDYPGAAAITRNSSGLLAMPISKIHKHYLLWFRPEQVYSVDWAGNPREKEVVAGHLSPRTSFAAWRETIHGHSRAWHDGEIELAFEFRNALLGIALERAEQMAELAEELGRANKELEAFSYSVSHDLRAPLRHIVGFSDLLIEADGNDDATRRQRFLKNIKDSARLAGKLVDDLLSFSQMGRASLRPATVNMPDLVRACMQKLLPDQGNRRIEWDIGPLPDVTGDPAFLYQALYNLLSNAVKFTGQQEIAVIKITAEKNAEHTTFHIADNGAGFSMEYVHKLFGVFQRLHRMEDFEGTGIGLANVRRIIERHRGRIWANAVPGQGATFSFSIPNHFEEVSE